MNQLQRIGFWLPGSVVAHIKPASILKEAGGIRIPSSSKTVPLPPVSEGKIHLRK
jgi:hypothetical protein